MKTENNEYIYNLTDVRDYKNPFSLLCNIKRVCWYIIQSTLFRFSPKIFNSFRRFILIKYGAKIGKGANIANTSKIWAPWNLIMDDYSCLGPYTIVENEGQVYIGEMSTISQYSYICTGTHDYTKKEHPLIIKPVYIGKGVWICADSFIAPGVKIGDLAVIGARSSVFKDMPENIVCAGNPCNPIKRRFEDIEGK